MLGTAAGGVRKTTAGGSGPARAEAAAKTEAPQRYRGGRKPKRPPGQPRPTAQRNFTAPESRIMKGKDGFVQASNAQAAVDAHAQIVVACRLTNNAADQAELRPLLAAIATGLGRSPQQVSADVGYGSANLQMLAARGIEGYSRPHGKAPGHRRGAAARALGRSHAHAPQTGRPPQSLPAQKADRRAGHRADKQARGLRQFPLLGFAKVGAEWALVGTAPNLTKLVRVTG